MTSIICLLGIALLLTCVQGRVKSGECPNSAREYGEGEHWECGTRCTDDFQCPHTEKCCKRKGCGNRCQEAIFDRSCEGVKCFPGKVCVLRRVSCSATQTCTIPFCVDALLSCGNRGTFEFNFWFALQKQFRKSTFGCF